MIGFARCRRTLNFAALTALFIGCVPAGTVPTRATGGLQALYDFASLTGGVVKDRSDAGEPLDLRISDTAAVRLSEGALEVRSPAVIRSDKPAAKIINAVRASVGGFVGGGGTEFQGRDQQNGFGRS